ncbi:hypothetical protein [Garciella nitratireducens]|uniref:TolB protein n=1 Tax=Garciella nitratireducens DSM 15102 TaxID=1121911 RepID=A0A1T4K2P4_9FIRM|nr:hypothetical protein [Garciella nitratireducens]RBP46634.1 hypothetical protein DFR81_10125 [Garciella nitratireducens]SJZ36701.1 hypothetical protein SAMN02745973_00303 [Garciella nitratireducens DSM 15102]
MNRNFLLSILILLTSLFIIGCNQSHHTPSINDFSISYLEIQDDKYLVGNKVLVQAQVKNANKVQLMVQDYGQNQKDVTIDGRKSGNHWEFTYENKDPFTKEIWLIVYGDNEKTIQSDKRIITNQDQHYKSAFENIIPVSTTEEKESINLEKRMGNFTILGWYDNENLLVQNNNNLILYNVINDKKNKILQDVWNIYVSPKLEYVVYQKKDEVYLFDFLKQNNKKIFKMKDSMTLKDLTWSRDQKYIILNIVDGIENLYYRINLKENDTKKVVLESFNKEQYMLEKLIYLDNHTLYALGRIINQDSNDQEIERPVDLLKINIITGKINKNYTSNMQSADEIKVLSQVNDREFLLRVSNKIISEEEMQSFSDIYLLNTQNGTFKKVKNDIDYPYIYGLSPNKRNYIYLKNVIKNGKSISNEKSIILGNKTKKEKEILRAINFYPTTFYWSENGEKIAFYLEDTKEMYFVEKKDQ